jgi:hypothetical protein
MEFGPKFGACCRNPNLDSPLCRIADKSLRSRHGSYLQVLADLTIARELPLRERIHLDAGGQVTLDLTTITPTN